MNEPGRTAPVLWDTQAWSATFSGPPVITGPEARWHGVGVGRWIGTDARMPQPPLKQHVLVSHLGGDKRVRRSGDGVRRVHPAPCRSLTLIPAGCGFDWLTYGPIDFAHLYISPERLSRTVATVFDDDPSRLVLEARVAIEAPLLAELMSSILEQVSGPKPLHGYLESLFEAALVQIVHHCSNIEAVPRTPRRALAPARLRRVLQHIEATLEGALDLQDLADVAGLSRFHFSRAFLQALGEPPLAYVARRRIEVASELLRTTALPIADVAARAGFNSAAYFSTAFRRQTGRSPREYRYGDAGG
jgi:AraC family transcriptional regulator